MLFHYSGRHLLFHVPYCTWLRVLGGCGIFFWWNKLATLSFPSKSADCRSNFSAAWVSEKVSISIRFIINHNNRTRSRDHQKNFELGKVATDCINWPCPRYNTFRWVKAISFAASVQTWIRPVQDVTMQIVVFLVTRLVETLFISAIVVGIILFTYYDPNRINSISPMTFKFN